MMKIRSYKFNWMCSDAHFLNCCSTGARAGTISFNEYCFRFGRRYQIEHNRRVRDRRFGLGASMASGCLSVVCSVPTLLGSHRVDPTQGSTSNKQTSMESERLQKDIFVGERCFCLANCGTKLCGTNPTMRHIERSHGISIAWLHETLFIVHHSDL